MQSRKQVWLGSGVVLSSIVASLCCVGPLVFAGLGLGIFTAGAVLTAVRPVFIVLAVGLLGAAVYFTRKERACADESCAVPKGSWRQSLFLWILGALALGMIMFPWWGEFLV